MIYLDHNATTPVGPEVRAAMLHALETGFGNPSSSHAAGRLAREITEKARLSVSALIGCGPDEILFTSGGTESNNLAITGTALAHGKGHIITSSIEHPSVTRTVRHLESMGFAVTFVGVDGDCRVRVDEILRAIREETILITIMHSNNETGVLQPVEEIGPLAREHGVRFHTDAAQSAGKAPVALEGIDLMSLASHKFYGPKGVGALYVRKGAPLRPIMHGAGHEGGMRPGTENVPGIAGMGKAAEAAIRELKTRAQNISRLGDLMLKELKKGIRGVRLNGHAALRLPGTLNLCLPGVDSARLVESLSGTLAISSGSACHAGAREPSPVLKAMGLGDEEAMASVRISIGKDNTDEEINSAARMLSDAFSPPGRAR